MILPVLFSVFYLTASFSVALATKNKEIGAQNVFHIAVLFTPLIALIIVVLSPKKKIVQSKMFQSIKFNVDYSDRSIKNLERIKEGIKIFEEPCKS